MCVIKLDKLRHHNPKSSAMNNIDSHQYCVILAGGRGKRLWPCSREKEPKQFIDFFGTGRTQLQQTFDRFARLLPADHIFVTTTHDYSELVASQLPELPAANILVEPILRNTAPSVLQAAKRISELDAEACIVVTPSDQAVQDDEAFRRNILDGLRFVAESAHLLVIGVRPTRPEPGYGYIQMGDEAAPGVYAIRSFTEKPDRKFAQMFIDSGEFCWNTGLFLGTARQFLATLNSILPPVDDFTLYPNLSIDIATLERSGDACAIIGDFGWADLGTWHSIYESQPKGIGDNVVVDSDVLIDSAHGNIIKLPKDHLAVIHGLEDYIVAEKDNVLLICKREDSSALVRKFANEVGLRHDGEFV